MERNKEKNFISVVLYLYKMCIRDRTRIKNNGI